MLKILKFSHHFALESPQEVYRRAIDDFARTYLLQITFYKLFNHKVVQRTDKMFAVRSKNPLVYRFHINILDKFLDYMRSRGFNNFDIKEEPMYEPAKAEFKLITDKRPWGMQPEIIEYLISPGKKKVVELQAGQGKGVLNGTPVRTLHGWTNIEDLKVGDKVMGETGEFHSVTGVYPQGNKDLYRFTFRDGRQIVTDESHLWSCSKSPKSTEEIINDGLVLSTAEIIDGMQNGDTFYIPVICNPVPEIMTRLHSLHSLYSEVKGVDRRVKLITKDSPHFDEIRSMCFEVGAQCIPQDNGLYAFSLTKQNYATIVSVEKLPEQGEATCISVDNPTKLFVTKDYLITHNTLCSLFAVEGIGERTLLSIKPMYIQRWLDDLTKDTGIFKLKKDEIVVIKGGQALASVIKMALDNKLTYKFIIISNKTLYNYYKDFTEGVNMEKYFNVKPFDLFKVLKVGVRIIDEAHQDFHQCFKTDLFSHVPKTIELSATLTPDSPFLKNMYEIMYPLEDRFGGGVYNKYVNVFSVPYRLDKSNTHSVRVNQRGMLSYSHGSMEESIMKNKQRLDNYLNMVLDLTETYFIKKRHADFKLLIFAGRVELCKLIVEKLQPLYPDLKITKYTEEEDYSILADMDIIVSTPISSGTAVDIPRLQVCINTVAIGSTQANLQMIGRLRELRGVDIKPTFLYLYCVDIAKHVEYHVKKRNHTFKDRVLSYTDLVPIKYTV